MENFLCFCWVMETWESLREREILWDMSHGWVFPQNFWVLPNCHKRFYNSAEIYRGNILLLEINVRKQKENHWLFQLPNVNKILFGGVIFQSAAHVSSCFYQVRSTVQLIACIFLQVFFYEIIQDMHYILSVPLSCRFVILVLHA